MPNRKKRYIFVIIEKYYSEVIRELMKKKLLAGALVGAALLLTVGCGKKDDKQEDNTSVAGPVLVELENAEKGNLVEFGAYEQDGNEENGKEAVEWLVLEVKDGKALLLSRYGLDFRPFDESGKEAAWENCSLRAWLNTEFYENAFTQEEWDSIEWTTLKNNGGAKDTEDKVFLLSVEEAEQYFEKDEKGADGRDYNVHRVAAPTKSALQKDNNTVYNGSWYDGNSPYWLRTTGSFPIAAAIVDYNGDIYDAGHGVGEPKDMVRPAIWIELK